MRVSVTPAALLTPLRQIVSAADPEQPISDVAMLSDVVGGETAPRVVQVRVLGAFAAIAFLLAAIGIHGLLSFSVSTRRQEIGVRLALGAQRGAIVRMILHESARLSAAGMILGSAAAFYAASAMRTLLAGLTPTDLPTYAAAIALCFVMTLFGSLLPALRALAVDPATVIRVEY
jgi:putative ABC transport system permease protein